ncbi:hypothetical protein AAMO2058_001370500 [Amorphochlora amoebiformis]
MRYILILLLNISAGRREKKDEPCAVGTATKTPGQLNIQVLKKQYKATKKCAGALKEDPSKGRYEEEKTSGCVGF